MYRQIIIIIIKPNLKPEFHVVTTYNKHMYGHHLHLLHQPPHNLKFIQFNFGQSHERKERNIFFFFNFKHNILQTNRRKMIDFVILKILKIVSLEFLFFYLANGNDCLGHTHTHTHPP